MPNEREDVKIKPVEKSSVVSHQKRYEKPEKTEVVTREFYTSKGDQKIKYIRVSRYRDGVIKNEIIGMKKNGKMMWGVSE
jgi:hypothetical protein